MIQWPIDVISSKYLRWYENLVNKAKNRLSPQGYTEEHHIIPRSMGGLDTKENLVRLSAREHYIAHLLLWKCKFPQPYHKKMVYAASAMSNKVSPNKKRNYKVNSRIYSSLRTEYAVHMSIEKSGEGNHFYGKTHSEQSMQKMLAYQRSPETLRAKSLRAKGDLNPAKNPDVKKLISESQKKRLARQKILGIGHYDPALLASRKILSAGSNNGNAKMVKFTDPVGNTTTIKGGFKKFCIENNLRYGPMLDVAKGRAKDYHGWTVEYIKD